MSESFYGGKAGAPFVIAKSYKSVDEMITDFAQGPTLTAVAYGDHVIINTDDKNNSNNGALYRRGYDYNNSMGGAIYVGTIVGPSGKSPMFELTTLDAIKDITFKDTDEVRQATGAWNISNNSLIPGKTDTDFNDDISWSYITIRDQYGVDTTAWVGIRIPYHVIEMDAHSESAYYNRDKETADFKNNSLVERDDDQEHPFYSHWQIHIPKGIKGDALKNFRVINASDAIEDYEGKADDVANNRQVLVYDYYCYDAQANGEPKTLYLGNYNMIKGIILADDGTFTIEYTHDSTVTYKNKIKWITAVSLEANGSFTINFNDETKYNTSLTWIKDMLLDADGTVTFKYSNKADVVKDKLVKWITSTTLNASTGAFNITFNDGTKYDNSLTWVKDITLATDGTVTFIYTNKDNVVKSKLVKWITSSTLNSTTGAFQINYNDGSNYKTTLKWINGITLADDGTVTFSYTTGDTEVLINKIKWVTNTVLSADGTLTITYNDGTKEVFSKEIKWISSITMTDAGLLTINYNNGSTAFTKSLVWPVKIELDSKANESNPGTQTIKVTYNNGTSSTIGQPLNYIMRVAVNPSNYHLLMLYSDPAKRGTVTYDGVSGWLDFGAVKDYDGILIGPVLNDTTIASLKNATIASCITYLNTAYPSGLSGSNLGKVLTISQDSDTVHTFYGFDYDANKWKYLGSFDKTTLYMCAARETDSDYELKKERLAVGGICFIIED